jgi:ubiquitin-like 1-activating enzyme E1 A
VAAEITKNIVLAGVGSITLLDAEDVRADDLGANFFLREEDVGTKVAPSRLTSHTTDIEGWSGQRVEAASPRIQALNPRVKVTTETDASKLSDEAFLSQFDLVVLTETDAPSLLTVNELTRNLSKKLFAASSMGIDGWIFADLLEHSFMMYALSIRLFLSVIPDTTA